MRFLSDGLNSPDELLEERDKGNVVFLCGAGVSYPAGMPTFLGLAKYVVDELGTPSDAPSRTMLSIWDNPRIPTEARPTLDEIFNLLQQEYAPEQIDRLIAKRLRTKPRGNLSAHETVLRLSRSAEGKPRIVTTNFDVLFETASHRKLKAYTAPALPDLARGQPLDGIVYLHGRINSKNKAVMEDPDFLAEAKKSRLNIDYVSPQDIADALHSINNMPPAIKEYLQILTGFKKPKA